MSSGSAESRRHKHKEKPSVSRTKEADNKGEQRTHSSLRNKQHRGHRDDERSATSRWDDRTADVKDVKDDSKGHHIQSTDARLTEPKRHSEHRKSTSLESTRHGGRERDLHHSRTQSDKKRNVDREVNGQQGRSARENTSHHYEDAKRDWSCYGYTAADVPRPEKSSSTLQADGKRQSSADLKQPDGRSKEENCDEQRSQMSRSEKQRFMKDKQAKGEKAMFDWERYRRQLDTLFFNDNNSAIQRKSEEYHDFWKFLDRYESFQFKRPSKQTTAARGSGAHEECSPVLGIPVKYDKTHRMNMSLVLHGVEDAKRRSSWLNKSKDDEDDLPSDRIQEFAKVLLYYMDFLQKQQFAKLSKLLRDRVNLPISRYRDMIIDAVRTNQVVIVAGDTGCGKSTQLPQYLLKAGFTGIACTQPRRIACISLAKRVGYETLHEYGMQVGYQIRFEASKNHSTKILFLTEGLLLRQLSTDPTLQQYSVVVIDEVHERHLHGDFLLGVLRCLLQKRLDLKLVLMSATINITLFSQYFDMAPVIQVPGRLYPITLEYTPPKEVTPSTEGLDPRPYLNIMQRIDKKYPPTERGDLLIFLSGMTEITKVTEAAKLYAAESQRWIVLLLHSTLSIVEQDKVFDIAPEGVRKCIVSTNIAETSVTIDGIRFIVDSGKVKEMSYNAEAKMQHLREFWISQASAEQRKGRAGRTGPGVCYRLYEESDYDDFNQYSTPEIHRVPLDSLILQMMALGLNDPRVFPFIEPPPASSIESSIVFLKEQGALDHRERLTPIGRLLSDLPVDVVIGKMLIMGTVFKMIEPILCIAAALSVQSPFTNRAYRNTATMSELTPLLSDHGDPFTLLNAYDEWIQVKAKGQPSRKWCKRRGLEEQRFYEMSKLKRQFQDLLRDQHLVERLSDRPSQRQLSMAERYDKNRDKRRLAEMRRKEHSGAKKRKLLRFGQEDDPSSDENEDSDLKSLEFKLSHDLSRLQTTASLNRGFTRGDMNLLKVILCSGLYPQLAIPDDCNTYRKDCDQVYHTKAKPFVLMHPTSVFVANPSVLEPPRDETGLSSAKELVASSKHQLIAYVNLLETTKPYLLNTMRVPALQTVVLYANCLDTNQDCTRLVADEWIEFAISDVDTAEHVVSAVIQLRAAWLQLLQIRLKDSSRGQRSTDEDEVGSSNLHIVHKERILSTKLAEFLDCQVEYTMRKLGSTELSNLYVGPLKGQDVKDSFFVLQSNDGKPHPTKGGTQVNEYLTHGCLYNTAGDSLGDYSSVMRRHWTCSHCDVSMIVTTLERLQHQCDRSTQASHHDDKESPVANAKSNHGNKVGMDALRRKYQCPVCSQEFDFTSTEVLRHKRDHAKEEMKMNDLADDC